MTSEELYRTGRMTEAELERELDTLMLEELEAAAEILDAHIDDSVEPQWQECLAEVDDDGEFDIDWDYVQSHQKHPLS